MKEFPLEITVDVTQDDIDTANRMRRGTDQRRTECCPIALASRRLLGTPATVGYEYINVREHGYGEKVFKLYNLPIEARQFIEDADGDRVVVPFSFVAELTVRDADAKQDYEQ